jgi:hypothetical protein
MCGGFPAATFPWWPEILSKVEADKGVGQGSTLPSPSPVLLYGSAM